ncbi:MAG: hypothetical protein LUE61_10835 [Clostridiales bacterium]|nr:hypothetical protein [Clostridiales bacterium]
MDKNELRGNLRLRLAWPAAIALQQAALRLHSRIRGIGHRRQAALPELRSSLSACATEKGAKAQDQERSQARAYPLRVILTYFKTL